ncbi:uncharacterized protein [Notamacropus eugenii]|uniref:uncharacterized protein isoform X2 n=1 Tax=Notamacropus eugenii TaxID=9315 RepID=UPI0021FA3243|nr:TPA_inf: Y-linked serine-like protease-like [Notamacropus eugenii]
MKAVLGLWGLSLVLSCVAGFSSPQKSKQDWETLRRPRNNQVVGSHEKVPWLVSVAGVCQGVLLNHWWVLSTASCLKNVNPGLLPMRGSGTWLNGSWICLHPNFVPPARAIAAKSDLGMVLLHQPARLVGGQVQLARDTSKAKKTCPFCGHQPCEVYQHQNPREPGLTPAKRMMVKFLGSWACRHLGVQLPEPESLCIWSDSWPGPDCWVQPGSPVLCHFGNRWELVGLVSAPTKICYVPVLAVRITPYLSWMDAVVQATQKQPLTFPCSHPDSSPIASLGLQVTPRLSSSQEEISRVHNAPGLGGGGKDKQLSLAVRSPSEVKLPGAATWLLHDETAEFQALPPTGEPQVQMSQDQPGPFQPVHEPALVQTHSVPNKARSQPQQGEHVPGPKPQSAYLGLRKAQNAVRPKTLQSANEGQTHQAEKPARPQAHPKANPLGPSNVPKTALAGLWPPQWVADTMSPWALSQTLLASRSQPHLLTETGRFPRVSKAHAARPQTHPAAGSPGQSASDIIGPWVLAKANPAEVEAPPEARSQAQPAPKRARPWMVPKPEAQEIAGPWVPSEAEAAGLQPQRAQEPAKAQTQRESNPAHVASPVPQPVADAAGVWAVPTPAVGAIMPWAGPVTGRASKAIIPWAGPAPARALAPSILPSPAPLSSGSLTYPGPFLSPRFFPSSQSLSPDPSQTHLAPFPGDMQALAWGPSRPSMPPSWPGPSLSSSSAPYPSPSPLPPSVETTQFRGPDIRQQPEELPLGVTLAQCRLGLGWRSNFQAYWLFQTALSSQQGIAGCGMRPGFAARCPNCWEAEEGEFPWVVSLQFSLSHFCSGSILNEWWVLTTASCANIIRNSESLARVQAGVNNLEDQVRAQLVGIHRALPYFGIEGPMGLGLILLQEPLHFQPRVLAVCLEESPEKPLAESQLHLYDCWIPGWTLIKGNLVTMQKQRLDVVEVSNCAHYWPIKNLKAFCVQAKKVIGQSSCKGDLGAPLMCRPKLCPEETPWVQMGALTAFDETCTRPYVFSQIHPFSSWLRASTKPQHPPWAKPAPRPTLSSLPNPEALVNRISLRFAMPWQALIVTCDNTICSGSILSPSWVLTSAHCIRDMRSENMAVFLGLPQPGGHMTAARVSSVVLHEQYQVVNGVSWNDLALILLQKPLAPTQPLAPVGHVKDVHNAECWLTGARELREGETDRYPQAFQVQVKDALACAQHFPGVRSSVLCLGPRLPEFQMALDLMGPGSALLCRSGGVNGTWRQTGLLSIKSLAFLLAPYFPWISNTSSVQTDHMSLNQSVGRRVPIVSAAGARGPLTLFPLLTLWQEFLIP